MIEKTIIIWGGPAGLTAGIYTARAWMNPLLFEGFMAEWVAPGGLLTMTSQVENFPWFPGWIRGGQLMQQMKEQALQQGVRIVTETIQSVDFSQNPFKISTGKEDFFAQSVIIATGAKPKLLHIPGEKMFWQRGISTCAVCDGNSPLYKNNKVAIIGWGDEAMEEALFMSNLAKEVQIITKKTTLTATKTLQERVQKTKNISIKFHTELLEAKGEKVLKSLILKDILTGNEVEEDFQGIFYALGRNPNSSLFSNQIETDNEGYIVIHRKGETSKKGIFAAGEVCDFTYQQAITSAAQWCQAAFGVIEYFQEIWQE